MSDNKAQEVLGYMQADLCDIRESLDKIRTEIATLNENVSTMTGAIQAFAKNTGSIADSLRRIVDEYQVQRERGFR